MRQVLSDSIVGKATWIPEKYFIDSGGEYDFLKESSRDAFRAALTNHLHSLTGVEPSLQQQQEFNDKGEKLWSVQVLLR